MTVTTHDCINLRLPILGGLYVWEFERRKQQLRVRVEGQLVLNSIALRLNAVSAGFGLAYIPEDQARAQLADRRLIRMLADWYPPFAGYHLYYPSHRQPTPAFALLVDGSSFRSEGLDSATTGPYRLPIGKLRPIQAPVAVRLRRDQAIRA
jgi:DNA-binding transcriptional LysR family regulator